MELIITYTEEERRLQDIQAVQHEIFVRAERVRMLEQHEKDFRRSRLLNSARHDLIQLQQRLKHLLKRVHYGSIHA